MSKNNDWKERLNIVYSTNPDFDYQTDDTEEQEEIDDDQDEKNAEAAKRRLGRER